MENEEILVIEFRRHKSPGYNELYNKTVLRHLREFVDSFLEKKMFILHAAPLLLRSAM